MRGLLHNGTIITCDDQSTIAEAVWIEGERIRAVGAPHTCPTEIRRVRSGCPRPKRPGVPR